MVIRPRVLVLPLLITSALASPAQVQLALLGHEFQVNTYTTSSQWFPTVAMDPSGNFLVVWRGQFGPRLSVFGQRYDSTGALQGEEFQVNTYSGSYPATWQVNPAAAMDSAGNFVVAWISRGQDGSGDGVFGQRFESSGAPLGGEFQINTYTTSAQFGPEVAMDLSGSFVVVWQSLSQDGSGYGVFGQRYDSTGDARGGEFQVNTYTTDWQRFAVVATDPNGGFVVAWTSSGQDGSSYGVFGQRFDSVGAQLGEEFQVNTYTTSYQGDPAVAMDSAGSFVVTWESARPDGSAGILAQRFDNAGMPLGGEFQVNTYTSNSQFRPAVVMDSAGSFVVAWTSRGQDGSGDGVFGQRFESAGAPLEGEFQINTHTTSAQFGPAVARDSAGRFVVTWSSQGQDGSHYGVFGQRFCPDTDADGLCNAEDVFVTAPLDGATVDCSDPKFVRPTIEWEPGNYEKFRVLVGTDPNFPTGTRITSGDGLLSDAIWTPPGKKWRSACNKALAADPINPVLYFEVLGVDTDLAKSDPYRKTFSQIVQADVQP